jgi:hypothetical protein
VGNLGRRHSNKRTQRIVDGHRILEDCRDIGIKEYDVRSLPIPLEVLPAHSTREVVLRPQIVVAGEFTFLTHMTFVRAP